MQGRIAFSCALRGTDPGVFYVAENLWQAGLELRCRYMNGIESGLKILLFTFQEPYPGLFYHLQRRISSGPPLDPGLFLLKVFVNPEEVAYLAEQMRGNVLQHFYIVPERVFQRHAEYLLVRPLLVPHLEQAHCPCIYVAARKGRFPDEYKGVERVPVSAERIGYEAVIAGVMHGREEHPVEPDDLLYRVILVLVPASLGYLYIDSDRIIAQKALRGTSWPSFQEFMKPDYQTVYNTAGVAVNQSWIGLNRTGNPARLPLYQPQVPWLSVWFLIAKVMSCGLFWMSSLWNMRWRWVLTVGSLMQSLSAISLFLYPCPTRLTTSRSLSDRAGRVDFLSACSPMRRFLISILSSQISPPATARTAFFRRGGVELATSTPFRPFVRTAEIILSSPQLVSMRMNLLAWAAGSPT